MTGTQLRDLRDRSGLGSAAFGSALGYCGRPQNISRTVRRMEGLNGEEIPYDAAERAQRFERGLNRLEKRWAADLD